MDCPVCYYQFNSKQKLPKILSKCGHTLCDICLNRLLIDSVLICPFCKETYTNISANDFPINYFIVNVIEEKQIQKQQSNSSTSKSFQIPNQKIGKKLIFPNDDTDINQNVRFSHIKCPSSSKFQQQQIEQDEITTNNCDNHCDKQADYYSYSLKKFFCKKCIINFSTQISQANQNAISSNAQLCIEAANNFSNQQLNVSCNKENDIILLEEYTEKLNASLQNDLDRMEQVFASIDVIRQKYMVMQREFQNHTKDAVSKADYVLNQLIKSLIARKEKLCSIFYDQCQAYDEQLKNNLSFMNERFSSAQTLIKHMKGVKQQIEEMNVKELFLCESTNQEEFRFEREIHNIVGSIIQNFNRVVLEKEENNEDIILSQISANIKNYKFDIAQGPLFYFDNQQINEFIEGFGEVRQYWPLQQQPQTNQPDINRKDYSWIFNWAPQYKEDQQNNNINQQVNAHIGNFKGKDFKNKNNRATDECEEDESQITQSLQLQSEQISANYSSSLNTPYINSNYQDRKKTQKSSNFESKKILDNIILIKQEELDDKTRQENDQQKLQNEINSGLSTKPDQSFVPPMNYLSFTPKQNEISQSSIKIEDITNCQSLPFKSPLQPQQNNIKMKNDDLLKINTIDLNKQIELEENKNSTFDQHCENKIPVIYDKLLSINNDQQSMLQEDELSYLQNPFKNKAMLLGNNNKMIIFDTISKSWSQHTLNFKFADPKEKRPYLLKNFAALTHIQGSLFFFCGGGPSSESVLLNFANFNKNNVQVTVEVKILPRMNAKRCWHYVVYFRPFVYVIGGFDGAKRLNLCEKIEVKQIFNDNVSQQQQQQLVSQLNQQQQQIFQYIAQMTEERCMFSACLCENQQRIYVCGGIVGRNGQNSDSIEYYSIIDNKWLYLQIKMPKKICGASMCFYSEINSLVIFGGSYGSQRMCRKILEFNIDKEKFEKIGKMKCKRQMNNKVFLVGKQAYLIGGNFQYNYEIVNLEDMSVDFKEKEYSYSCLVKNDLNNYASAFVN